MLLLALAVCLPNLIAQDEHRCKSTVQWHEQKMQDDPDYAEHVKKHRNFIDSYVYQEKNPACTNGPLIIPIAVHFDSGAGMPTSATEQACAITMAQNLVAQLNQHFSGLEPNALNFNSTYGGTGCLNASVGQACLQFCLATENHPTGFGLTNGNPAVTFGTADLNYPTQTLFGVVLPSGTPINAAWAGYINIYVTDLSSTGGVLGISNGIPGNFNGDGVMINACQFGTAADVCGGWDNTDSCGAPFGTTQGKALTHEIGHFLGLFHIWGDELLCTLFPDTQCSGSDQISDTPNMSCSYGQYADCGSHSTCSDLPVTCGSPDMYMNFMAYASDPCMYMFTSEQADVVYATAVSQGYTTTPPPSCIAGACPPNYALSGMEPGTGGADYETDGPIVSTQNVTGGLVDYDSGANIILNPGFQVLAGGFFCAFIDGCNGSGGVVFKSEEEEDKSKEEDTDDKDK